MDNTHVINCNDVPKIDMTRHDGGLEHKAGVYTYQIRRSCRSLGDYTYNRAPMLTAFNNRLVLSYISGSGPCGPSGLCGISGRFQLLSPCVRQVTHALLTRPPLSHKRFHPKDHS